MEIADSSEETEINELKGGDGICGRSGSSWKG